jgi:hypothetical protein
MDAHRGALNQEICARFWDQVVAGQRELAGLDSMDLMQRLNGWLEPLMPDVAVEVSGDAGSERELVVTAHGSLEHFAAVQALATQAPPLLGWRVTAFRRRTDGEFGMRMDGFELNAGDVLVRHWAEAGQVALEIGFAKEVPSDLRDHARHMAFIMLDHILGEYDFAVKVGPVDFAQDSAASSSAGLHEFAPLFDACWAGELGRTGDFPQGEHAWTGLTVQRRSGDELLVMRNDSAGAVAADLGWRITVSMSVPSHEALDEARAFEERLCAALEPGQDGICSHVVLDRQVRHMTWYVTDAQAALQQAESLLADMRLNAESLAQAHDPAWKDYLAWSD